MLPQYTADASRIAAQAPLFTVDNHVLYYLDNKQPDIKRAVVPKHLRKQIMQDYHSGCMAGHFSGPHLQYTKLCYVSGGGMECTAMLWVFVRLAQTVLL